MRLCIGISDGGKYGIRRAYSGPSGGSRCYRSLSHSGSADHHGGEDILEPHIRECSDTAFPALFRMHRASFW